MRRLAMSHVSGEIRAIEFAELRRYRALRGQPQIRRLVGHDDLLRTHSGAKGSPVLDQINLEPEGV